MIGTLPFAPTSHHQPKTLFWKNDNNAFFSSFFLEDEEDEEMVEPKTGHDSELENQDKKQEVKEGMMWEINWVIFLFYFFNQWLRDYRGKEKLNVYPLCGGFFYNYSIHYI